jgi:hypothetical protein
MRWLRLNCAAAVVLLVHGLAFFNVTGKKSFISAVKSKHSVARGHEEVEVSTS